jgi:hypothetical protein
MFRSKPPYLKCSGSEPARLAPAFVRPSPPDQSYWIIGSGLSPDHVQATSHWTARQGRGDSARHTVFQFLCSSRLLHSLRGSLVVHPIHCNASGWRFQNAGDGFPLIRRQISAPHNHLCIDRVGITVDHVHCCHLNLRTSRPLLRILPASVTLLGILLLGILPASATLLGILLLRILPAPAALLGILLLGILPASAALLGILLLGILPASAALLGILLLRILPASATLLGILLLRIILAKRLSCHRKARQNHHTRKHSIPFHSFPLFPLRLAVSRPPSLPYADSELLSGKVFSKRSGGNGKKQIEDVRTDRGCLGPIAIWFQTDGSAK